MTFAPVPQGSVIDLTAEGKLDWVHWGLYTDSSITRKAGVARLLSDFEPVGPSNALPAVYQYADNFNGYTWYDGFPEPAATNTITGVWAYAMPARDMGFQITAAAGPTPRILKVYVGTYAARGRFEAYLSDSSAPGYTNASLHNTGNGPGAVYTVEYAADAVGQKLVARWVLDQGAGSIPNVTLQAAALSEPAGNNPPIVALIGPTADASVPAGSVVTLEAAASDVDGQVRQVEFYAGEVRLGEDTTPDGSQFRFEWSGAAVGRHSVRARAIDDGGASRWSAPVDVFVHSSGGMLTGSIGLPAAWVDLTAEGTGDWVHWGLLTSRSVDRKAGVVPQISELKITGDQSPRRYTNNFTSFAWSDGAPTAVEPGSATGLFLTGFTNGFCLTVPADVTARTLKLYLGLYGAAGTLRAWLSDGSAPAYSDTSLNDIYATLSGVYSLNYAAAGPGQTLTVQYISTRLYDMDYGNISLQAAAVQGAAPAPPLAMLNARREGDLFVFQFSTEAGKSYVVQRSVFLPAVDWETIATIGGDGNIATVNDPLNPTGQAFYRIRQP